MAIEKIKRLKLINVKSEREALFRELLILGCVQIPEQESEMTGSFFREEVGLAKIMTELEKLCKAIELLEKYVPPRSKIFSSKPKFSKQTLLDDGSTWQSIELSDRIRITNGQIESIKAEESVINGILDTLKPWSNLDIPLGLRETASCLIMPGFIPVSAKLTAIENDLSSEVPESQIIKINSDKVSQYIILVVMKENWQMALETMHKYGFEPLTFENMTGTVRENISGLRKKLSELSDEKKELISSISTMSETLNELKLCADRLLNKAEMTKSMERLLCTDYTVNFEGFYPADKEKSLGNVLSGFDCAWEISETTKDETAMIPFKLRRGLFYHLRKRKLLRAGRGEFQPLSIKTNYIKLIKAAQ